LAAKYVNYLNQYSYDVNFYCHIIFDLDQQQIARTIRYEGKAC